jgi:hypothetical protein
MESSNTTKVKDAKIVKEDIPIPCHAIGVIIGRLGHNIEAYRNTPGITKAQLVDHVLKPSEKILIVQGENKSVQLIVTRVKELLDAINGKLHSRSRQLHSWNASKNDQIFTPREIHKTGRKAPTKGSKQWEKERDRMKEIRVCKTRGINYYH